MRRKPSEWVKGRVLMETFDISAKHLARLRQEGTLKHKLHWKNIGLSQAARPTYRYHLKRCEEVIDRLQAYR